MRKVIMLAAIAAATGTATAAAGQKADDAARAFGAREDVRQISISPDGNRIAMVRAAPGAGSALVVVDLTADRTPRTILTSTGRPDQLVSCNWSTSTRLVCNIATLLTQNAMRLGFSRVLTLNADGSDMRQLTGETQNRIGGAAQFGGSVIDLLGDEGAGGAVLMTRSFGQQMTTGTMLASTATGLGVERVDTTNLRRQQVERPSAHASEYITDGHGTVRVMGVMRASDSGMLEGRTTYLYRKPGDRAWLPLSVVTSTSGVDSGFDPWAVDRDLNAAYGFDTLNGRNALFRVALDGSLKRELVLDNPNVDVDSLVTIGRQHRVVGASFATDKRQTVIFDPPLKALAASLSKALPHQPIVSIVDASADEQKLVLFAGSDVDPGRFYLFDRPNKKLAELLPVRPQLARQTLAPVKPITFKAADGTTIPAYLTLPAGSSGKGLPAIVLPHGGPGARDEWGFDWLPQFFASRGYAVLQPNFRGSTGYGSAWFQKNGFQSWRVAIGDVNDAGRYLLSSGIAAPDTLGIVGWSYGGYAALQSAVLDPDLFRAIVAVAPVTDLETLRGEHRDFTDAGLVDAFIGHGAHVREGSPAQNPGRIKAPVLMFHGDLDQNVGIGESRLMASRLRGAGKKVELVEYKGLTHQLDDSDVRADMLGKSDAFLRAAFGLGN
ncbi:S9 family peptidase [Sphingomonas sp. RP10(2022)]|uniref:S9 family peptidase n=1 Tax=Sphingomonas liriopis TaxID=2949094 RepID=A0A9X2HVY5_9SPHN|nr:S9 family peptidase [Sphingomonas liriopis]MCP3735171.1 S9 family peptidase [Sphingomonas liriopis]